VKASCKGALQITLEIAHHVAAAVMSSGCDNGMTHQDSLSVFASLAI